MKVGVIADRAFRHSFTLSKPSMDDHENVDPTSAVATSRVVLSALYSLRTCWSVMRETLEKASRYATETPKSKIGTSLLVVQGGTKGL